jgi:N-acetylglucosaminyldiphosphoundecaprenol N-acetyl-beta-D-mannosaminyltransferase
VSTVLSRSIVSTRVDATSYSDAVARILTWATAGESRYACAASVNNVVEAHRSGSFREVMNAADLVTPDGVPLVWSLRLLGLKHATRVYGPDLTLALAGAAAEEGVPVGFLGGHEEVLRDLVAGLRRRFPGLIVSYAWSPPFRRLEGAEDERMILDIERSGARILFVGLGAPKQEQWMAEHRGRIPAVMVGVGAAFDFLAGRKRQAPSWMQRVGLEWLFRLVQEPRRLWKRYLVRNPVFLALFGAQLFRERAAR